jgi:hypothetical protein|eukprot:COSAG02_NODE_785_length_17228_cov_24.082141_5_plen_178_part_00
MTEISYALGYKPGFINAGTVVPFTRATLAEANFFQRELVKMTSALGHRSMSGHDADHLPVVSDTLSISACSFYMLLLRPALEVKYYGGTLDILPTTVNFDDNGSSVANANTILIKCNTLSDVLELFNSGRLGQLRHIGGLHGLMIPRCQVTDLATGAKTVAFVLAADPRTGDGSHFV